MPVSAPEGYELYADESGSHASDYMGLAAILGTPIALARLRKELQESLDRHGVTEAKFSEVKTHRPKIENARQFLRTAVQHADKNCLRIVVLSWSHKDSRHHVRGRDDVENLHRMYYHFLSVALRRFPGGSAWRLFPDEKTEMDWQRVAEVLGNTSYRRRRTGADPQLRLPLPRDLDEVIRELSSLKVTEINEKVSHEEPLVQLADLLAGFASFARTHCEKIRSWLQLEETKEKLEGDMFSGLQQEDTRPPDSEPTKAEVSRFAILRDFSAECRARKHGVSPRTNGYLASPAGAKECPIWFWHWAPQGEYDKAPTRALRHVQCA